MNRSIDFIHLTDEEIAYELALRHVTNLAPTTKRARVTKLKALVQEDILRDTVYVNSEYVMQPELNMETCQSAIRELRKFVDLAIQNDNQEQIKVVRSRLLHYRHRLHIIPSVVPLEETRNVLIELVETLIAEINSVVNKVQSDSGNISGGTIDQSSAAGATRRTSCDAQLVQLLSTPIVTGGCRHGKAWALPCEGHQTGLNSTAMSTG